MNGLREIAVCELRKIINSFKDLLVDITQGQSIEATDKDHKRADYLLIARFTSGDIPLRLFGSQVGAETEAKTLHANPSLLNVKWQSSLCVWQWHPGDFVGALVLCIDALNGYPTGVAFDSTEDGEAELQTETTTRLPEGHIEITDPNHELRPGIDLYLSKYALNTSNLATGQWLYISETDTTLIGEWGKSNRFCCPAHRHPDLDPNCLSQDAIKEFKELRDVNACLRDQVSRIQSEYNRVSDLNSQLERNAVQWSQTVVSLKQDIDSKADQIDTLDQIQENLIDDNRNLRRLNEDLNNRLKQVTARSEAAVSLESRIRKAAVQFLNFHTKLRERRVWSATFAIEQQMAEAYAQALMTAEEAFTNVFFDFLRSFPHVQPDMPEEWHIYPNGVDD